MKKLQKIWDVLTGRDEIKNREHFDELLKIYMDMFDVGHEKEKKNREANYHFMDEVLRKKGKVLSNHYGGFIFEYGDYIYLTNGLFKAYTGNPKSNKGDVGKFYIQSHKSSIPEIFVDLADAPGLAKLLNDYTIVPKDYFNPKY